RMLKYSWSTSFFTAATTIAFSVGAPFPARAGPGSMQPQANSSGTKGNSRSICKGSNRWSSSWDAGGRLRRRKETPLAPTAQKARRRGCQLRFFRNSLRSCASFSAPWEVKRPFASRSSGISISWSPSSALRELWLISRYRLEEVIESDLQIFAPRKCLDLSWTHLDDRLDAF